jgi:AcrR family transcriptional regulator
MAKDTRERLMISAERLLSTRGLARIGTRDIARSAEFADGTLYKHFRGKNELIIAVLERAVPMYREALRDLPLQVGLGTVKGNLEKLAFEAFTYNLTVAPLICSLFADRILLKSTRERLRRIGSAPERSFEILGAYLCAEQRLGRIAKDTDCEAAASILFNAVFGMAVFDRYTDGPPNLARRRKRIAALISVLLRGIAPRGRAFR